MPVVFEEPQTADPDETDHGFQAQQDALDEALEESFPASDPVAFTRRA